MSNFIYIRSFRSLAFPIVFAPTKSFVRLTRVAEAFSAFWCHSGPGQLPGRAPKNMQTKTWVGSAETTATKQTTTITTEKHTKHTSTKSKQQQNNTIFSGLNAQTTRPLGCSLWLSLSPLTLWQSEFMARIFNSSRPFLMQFVSVARDERVSDINFTKQKREKGTEIDRKRERGSVR